MNFQNTFLCSLQNHNDECLDSPPRVAPASVSVLSGAASRRNEKQHQDEEEEEEGDGHGGILQRSRARMEERAQFLKECELMMIKTTLVKSNLLGTPTQTSTSLPVGGGGESSVSSLRLKKLWDFSNEDEMNDSAELQQPQQRDDEDGTNYAKYYQGNDDDDDDDDDDEMLWPSTKIRRESRRSKLGLQSMREQQELKEVERFVAEMRKKRMARVEERQKCSNLLTLRPLDDGLKGSGVMLDKELVATEEEKHEENEGIMKDNDDVIDDLEEYTAIRHMDAVLSSPRDTRLQRIRKWKDANSPRHHPMTSISTMSTNKQRTTGSTRRTSPALSLSCAMLNSTAEEGSLNEADSSSKKEKQTSLSDLELKRWWIEHKRSTNHVPVSMPSFEELVDEPTIATSKKQQPPQQPPIETTSTSMRIEQLRCRRKGVRGDNPTHPEDNYSTRNNDSMPSLQKVSTSPPPPPPLLQPIRLSKNESSSLTEHQHTIDDANNLVGQSTRRLEEAKIKFAEAAAKSTSSSSKGQKDVNNFEEQAALADLISSLGEAVVAMKQLDQYSEGES